MEALPFVTALAVLGVAVLALGLAAQLGDALQRLDKLREDSDSMSVKLAAVEREIQQVLRRGLSG